jgi:hypothetical protein
MPYPRAPFTAARLALFGVESNYIAYIASSNISFACMCINAC